VDAQLTIFVIVSVLRFLGHKLLGYRTRDST